MQRERDGCVHSVMPLVISPRDHPGPEEALEDGWPRAGSADEAMRDSLLP